MSEEQVAVSESSPKKSKRLKSGLLLLGFAGVLGISAGIFAANITVTTNGNGNIEFGAGTAIVSSCVSSVEVDMQTSFQAGPSPKFLLDSVNVTDIDNSCSDSEVLKVDVMNTAGISLLTTATPRFTITANPDEFLANFSDDEIDTEDVGYILLETSGN